MKNIRMGSNRANSRRGIRSMMATSKATSKQRKPSVRSAAPMISEMASSSDSRSDEIPMQAAPKANIARRPTAYTSHGMTSAPNSPAKPTPKKKTLTL